MDLPVYENPAPAVIRKIHHGIVHFPDRRKTPWEAYRGGFLVAIAKTQKEAEERWAAAKSK